MPKSFLITNKRYVTGSGDGSSSSSRWSSATSRRRRGTTADDEEQHVTSLTCDDVDDETGEHQHH